MGILFAERLPTLSLSDDETPIEPISVKYNLNGDPNNNDMKVTFSKECAIPLSTIYENEAMMVAFHEMIQNWKSYGLAGMANAGAPEAFRKERLDGRDHLLLPIIGCDDDGSIAINWELMANVTQGRMIPYLRALDSHWPFIPFVGQLSRTFICRVCVGLCLIVVAPGIIRPLLPEEIIGGVILAGISIFWWLTLTIPPQRMIPYSSLDNYFLIQKGIPNNTLYISHHDNDTSHLPQHPNGHSSFLSSSARSSLTMAKNDHHVQKFNLNLSTATYEQYYTHKYGIDVTFPHLPLLPAHPIQKHVDFDLWMDHRVITPNTQGSQIASSSNHDPVHLLPELVHLFPLPRDVLYISRHVNKYLPPLHRYVHLTHLSQRLLSLASSLTPSTPTRTHPLPKNRTLPSLLEESLSIHPCTTYNRLEFLGDAVLRFLSSLVLFRSNASLIYDVEEMELLLGRSVTNKMLFERGLSLGLDGIILRKEGEGWEMGDKVVSDVLEALVAVGYLWDERMCVALLNEMRLPLVPREQRNEGGSWFTPYDKGGGACLVMGYDFNNDDEWFKELVNVGLIIYNLEEVSVALERGFMLMAGRFPILAGKLPILSGASTVATTSTNNDVARLQRNKVLLMAALFDDSLGYRSDVSSSKASGSKGSKTFNTTGGGSSVASGSFVSLGSSGLDDSSHRHDDDDIMSTPDKNTQTASLFRRTMSDISNTTSNVSDDDDNNDDNSVTGLERVALLRDTLFVIGNAALHLMSSQQSYLHYPNATAGDLHMLKTCAISDDVLAYVMIRSGLYECLYDKENVMLWDLRDVVHKSEEIGRKVWEEKGSTVVPVPKYVGLAGGRLYETDDSHDDDDASSTVNKTMTTKLDPKLTEDVAFSFKAIVGALVLGLGLEQMWEGVVKELLGELLSLSPEELRREYGEVSDICKNYQKGYESALVKDVR